jgi:hypothetical protein
VALQIAMSLTLLVGCGLLLRTIYALRHVPLGFRTDHVMVANMSIPAYKYVGVDIQRTLYQPLLERVQHLPGVQSAALMTEVPLGKTFNMTFTFGIGQCPGILTGPQRRDTGTLQRLWLLAILDAVFGMEERYFTDLHFASSQFMNVPTWSFQRFG